ncbi:hypothetical protein [Pseudoduganella violaceinigra]|uniref:hypothetical protein n=1 Tax=Pseudoduganella violaceinigra TaxID=246602 RepID=UPI000411696C|nr:hypothetical protein [Pseudoduganella violaceinigra]
MSASSTTNSDQQPGNLAQTLAAARASGIKAPSFKHQPSWQELELDGHLKRLGWGLLIYILALAAFWLFFLGRTPASPQVWLASLAMLVLSYVFMSLNAYLIQSKLNAYELSQSGAWQTWAASLFLNPAVLGGLVALIMFFRARDIKRKLETRR